MGTERHQSRDLLHGAVPRRLFGHYPGAGPCNGNWVQPIAAHSGPGSRAAGTESGKGGAESAGHSVTILADARDALSLLASNAGHFDAVLLDLGHPGMSRKEFRREILEIQPAIKIVPSTGYPEAEARRWLEGVETAGFVQKPYTAAELKLALKRALS